MSKSRLFTPLVYEKLTRFGKNDIEPFILWCKEQNASDVTIQSGEKITCHIEGLMHKVTQRELSASELVMIIGDIYGGDGVMAILNSGRDHDMTWTVKVQKKVFRFRINMKSIGLHNEKGYSITIRIIKNNPPALETMQLPDEVIAALKSSEGMALITGSTGTGKSTLLASFLAWRMQQEDAHLKIATYESPIEFTYDEVQKPTSTISQMEIQTHIETFAMGIRNSLRCAANIILIGEMRDRETTYAALDAAMTGTMLFSTLHTNGVPNTINRIVNFFTPEERSARIVDLLSYLKIILSQKLVPGVNGKRVAIREYLIFNQEVVDYLVTHGFEKITYETRNI